MTNNFSATNNFTTPLSDAGMRRMRDEMDEARIKGQLSLRYSLVAIPLMALAATGIACFLPAAATGAVFFAFALPGAVSLARAAGEIRGLVRLDQARKGLGAGGFVDKLRKLTDGYDRMGENARSWGKIILAAAAGALALAALPQAGGAIALAGSLLVTAATCEGIRQFARSGMRNAGLPEKAAEIIMEEAGPGSFDNIAGPGQNPSPASPGFNNAAGPDAGVKTQQAITIGRPLRLKTPGA